MPQPNVKQSDPVPTQILERGGAVFIGGMIILLYGVFLAIFFAGFSGYLARVVLIKEFDTNRAAAIIAEPGNRQARRSLDVSLHRHWRLEKLETSVKPLRELEVSSKLELRSKEESLMKATDVWQSQRSQLQEVFATAEQHIRIHADDLNPQVVEDFLYFINDHGTFLTASALAEFRGRLSGIVAIPEQSLDAAIRQKFQVLMDRTETDFEGFDIVHQNVQQKEHEKTLHLAEYQAILTELGETQSEIRELRASIDPTHSATLHSYRDTLAGLPYRMIGIPTILLTLIVTISSGGLGAVVSFTRRFLGAGSRDLSEDPFKSNKGISRLLLNVGEGVAASIAIFLFAGTGLLMLTQGGESKPDTLQLSPYLVAFLAFVSGFKAEDAFEKIHEFGNRTFGGQNGDGSPPRAAQ